MSPSEGGCKPGVEPRHQAPLPPREGMRWRGQTGLGSQGRLATGSLRRGAAERGNPASGPDGRAVSRPVRSAAAAARASPPRHAVITLRMLDQVIVRVRSLGDSKEFYDAVLGALGYRTLRSLNDRVGYGDSRPHFWIAQTAHPQSRAEVTFVAKNRSAVDAFYAKALELDAKSESAPGLHTGEDAVYYGASVLDPHGNGVAAVCHQP
jgi:catechol 2,3-dioxygenase-like lactoylglutathione lyase family enzyme